MPGPLLSTENLAIRQFWLSRDAQAMHGGRQRKQTQKTDAIPRVERPLMQWTRTETREQLIFLGSRGKLQPDWNENRGSSAGQGRVGHLRRDVRTRKHKEERHLLRKCPRVTKVRSPYMVNSGGTEMLVWMAGARSWGIPEDIKNVAYNGEYDFPSISNMPFGFPVYVSKAVILSKHSKLVD